MLSRGTTNDNREKKDENTTMTDAVTTETGKNKQNDIEMTEAEDVDTGSKTCGRTDLAQENVEKNSETGEKKQAGDEQKKTVQVENSVDVELKKVDMKEGDENATATMSAKDEAYWIQGLADGLASGSEKEASAAEPEPESSGYVSSSVGFGGARSYGRDRDDFMYDIKPGDPWYFLRRTAKATFLHYCMPFVCQAVY